jgi:hypothetical protein
MIMKDLCTYSMRFLRHKKSLRDHDRLLAHEYDHKAVNVAIAYRAPRRGGRALALIAHAPGRALARIAHAPGRASASRVPSAFSCL